MCYLQGVALDVAGNIYVADTGNSLARMVTRSPTKKDTLIAEFPGSSDNTNDCGPATAAKLQLPFGISADVSGNIYTADSGNSVIRIVAKDTGNISIVAGKSFASLFPLSWSHYVMLSRIDNADEQSFYEMEAV